jgi:hypothetical protein
MGLFLPWAGVVFGTAAAVDTRGAVEEAGACVPCSIFVNWLASAFEFGAAAGACPYFFPTLACLDGCPGLAAVWDQANPEINNTAKTANFMVFSRVHFSLNLPQFRFHHEKSWSSCA